MLDNVFIQRKIKLIQEDLERLEALSTYSFDDLMKEQDRWNAAERYLEKIIMRAIDINQHIVTELGSGTEQIKGYEDTFYAVSKLGVYDETFAKLIAPSAGLRNRLVHEYNNTQDRIIYDSVSDALQQYAQYCNAMLEFLKK